MISHKQHSMVPEEEECVHSQGCLLFHTDESTPVKYKQDRWGNTRDIQAGVRS